MEERAAEPRAGSSPILHSAPAKVALSTSATWPATSHAFELASRLGYDGVEVMVSVDPVSQDVAALAGLSEYYEMPVLSLHAPTLLLTQRVWGTDPWGKIDTGREVAAALGARTVVVHPPFRWQRVYARDFVDGIASRNLDGGPMITVENMFPWRAGTREVLVYAPGWDPRDTDYQAVTLDLSHTAVSGSDALAMAEDLGERLWHVHLADGTGSSRDEHMVPGRGNQPCAELLDWLARRWFTGTVVVEVSTRGAADRDQQETDLAEALAYARLNLVVPAERYAGP
jgi:sugar phosphate isomerase/epimerase